MLKKILEFIKKIIFSSFILYGYNLIAAPIGLIVPINIITISLLTILGMPALFSLIIILLLVF